MWRILLGVAALVLFGAGVTILGVVVIWDGAPFTPRDWKLIAAVIPMVIIAEVCMFYATNRESRRDARSSHGSSWIRRYWSYFQYHRRIHHELSSVLRFVGLAAWFFVAITAIWIWDNGKMSGQTLLIAISAGGVVLFLLWFGVMVWYFLYHEIVLDNGKKTRLFGCLVSIQPPPEPTPPPLPDDANDVIAVGAADELKLVEDDEAAEVSAAPTPESETTQNIRAERKERRHDVPTVETPIAPRPAKWWRSDRVIPYTVGAWAFFVLVWLVYYLTATGALFGSGGSVQPVAPPTPVSSVVAFRASPTPVLPTPSPSASRQVVVFATVEVSPIVEASPVVPSPTPTPTPAVVVQAPAPAVRTSRTAELAFYNACNVGGPAAAPASFCVNAWKVRCVALGQHVVEICPRGCDAPRGECVAK